MNSYYHAKAAARRWGGAPEDYLAVETFIDSSKETLGDVRHRAFYHHTAGVFLCVKVFGTIIQVQKGSHLVEVPVRLIAEQHIIEDLGWLPTPEDWLRGLPVSGWMSGAKLRDEPLDALRLTEPVTTTAVS